MRSILLRILGSCGKNLNQEEMLQMTSKWANHYRQYINIREKAKKTLAIKYILHECVIMVCYISVFSVLY